MDIQTHTPVKYKNLTPGQKKAIVNGCGGKGGFVKPPHKVFFRASCNHHDFLYYRGCDEAHRLEADTLLYRHMRHDCVSLPWWQWIRYRPWCDLYFLAIRFFGVKFFYYGSEKRYPVKEVES